MTTITVDDETHSNVVKLQSVLNLTAMSGEKYSLSQTVNYAVSNMQFTPQQVSNLSAVANTYGGSGCVTYTTNCSEIPDTSTSTACNITADKIPNRLVTRKDK